MCTLLNKHVVYYRLTFCYSCQSKVLVALTCLKQKLKKEVIKCSFINLIVS